MKNEIIGTDISLDVCKAEGYLMVETQGEFQASHAYRVFAYFPEWQTKTVYADRLAASGEEIFAVDTRISWDEAKRIFEANREALSAFADDMPSLMSTATPTYYTLVQAADTINGYQGLP